MNAPVSITAPLDPATMALVEARARARGISEAEFASEAIRRVAAADSDLVALAQQGFDDIDAGRLHTQEEVEAWFEARYRGAAGE